MLKLAEGKKTSNATRQHKGLHVMWEYLSTYSKAAEAGVSEPVLMSAGGEFRLR